MKLLGVVRGHADGSGVSAGNPTGVGPSGLPKVGGAPPIKLARAARSGAEADVVPLTWAGFTGRTGDGTASQAQAGGDVCRFEPDTPRANFEGILAGGTSRRKAGGVGDAEESAHRGVRCVLGGVVGVARLGGEGEIERGDAKFGVPRAILGGVVALVGLSRLGVVGDAGDGD